MSDEKKVRSGHSKAGLLGLLLSVFVVFFSIQLWLLLIDAAKGTANREETGKTLILRIMLFSIAAALCSIAALMQRKRLRRTGLWGLALLSVPWLVIFYFVMATRVTEPGASYVVVRKAFKTKLIKKSRPGAPPPTPPSHELKLVHYPSNVGKLAAYISHNPQKGRRHPAIIWKFGGFGNGIGGTAWSRASHRNDQSASAFRKAGIVTMYPSVRGGNNNPGSNEWFYGEVDDILSAYKWLAKQSYVDPNRIYLGGHSTGGTLALLVAAMPNKFRAIFAFGPVELLRGYGGSGFGFDKNNPTEWKVRSPLYWINQIKTPTFAFEGAKGNASSITTMAARKNNSNLHLHIIKGFGHFDLLAPVYPQIVNAIKSDHGKHCQIQFSTEGLTHALLRTRKKMKEAAQIRQLYFIQRFIKRNPRLARIFLRRTLSVAKDNKAQLFQKMQKVFITKEQRKFVVGIIKELKDPSWLQMIANWKTAANMSTPATTSSGNADKTSQK